MGEAPDTAAAPLLVRVDDGADADADWSSRPHRIALFVEPSPFAYISGYKNRFQNFIKHLREMGDEVLVVTTHKGAPEEFHGAKVVGSWSFPCPLYQNVPLSLALSPRIYSEVRKFKPDIIHATSPGIMVFGALAIAKMISVPMVMSYHTHLPAYLPGYNLNWLLGPTWCLIRCLHRSADLTLVPSVAIAEDFETAKVVSASRVRLWNKGVDSESFHPKFRSHVMRAKLSGGESEKPLVIHVGRFGREKNLDFLKRVMEKLPGVRIAFVGDGPYRAELEKMFAGLPAVFTGMLQGEELSQAYASGDVFVMPSESETLGQVVLESMASGVPVVAARAGGIPDIIPKDKEGKTSFLFTPGDLDECVRKIQQLLSSNDLRESVGRAAREEMENCDWRTASKAIRNEHYSTATSYWRKKTGRTS
ncbi:sulfoquinovosyl transferase SQD2-like [Lolium rigidum]|uniref:sulfoquinovosyl transferase SQD2-like n=1 Tax=Lolium rigidum TaxID=89674 RepID=UPI001F5C51E5|nr:sulfoquinovosyl transferase SQD2-like [Lolium rigidum]XP_051182120.1 sulfoquinovosyl transferase SQD2-like isoform X1 [Lolium perenne]